MEQAVADGRIHCIGLSNYYEPEDFDRVANAVTIKPAVLQNETHPYHQSHEMRDHIAQYGTVLESWFPLGGRGNTQTLFDDPTIAGIGRSTWKILCTGYLRWHLQDGHHRNPRLQAQRSIFRKTLKFCFALTDEESSRWPHLKKMKETAIGKEEPA